MVDLKISDLGPRISPNIDDDILQPALGNGTLKPGEPALIDPATDKVGAAIGRFAGIIQEVVTQSIDLAIPDGDPLSLIQPVDGQEYRILITDPTATYNRDHPVKIDTTTGKFVIATNLADSVVAKLKSQIVSGTLATTIIWGTT